MFSLSFRRRSLAVALPYAIVVLAFDFFNKSHLLSLGLFDGGKFLFWLIIPILLTYGDWDAGYYGVRRWRPIDALILLGLAAVACASLTVIREIPSLAAYYPLRRTWDPVSKSIFLKNELIWNLSWLPGWEFLNRYYLLRAAKRESPRFALVLVPVVEGLYHLQKPWPEMVGMVLLSLVLTGWAIRRNNGLLPLLVHAAIEMGLIVYLIF